MAVTSPRGKCSLLLMMSLMIILVSRGYCDCTQQLSDCETYNSKAAHESPDISTKCHMLAEADECLKTFGIDCPTSLSYLLLNSYVKEQYLSNNCSRFNGSQPQPPTVTGPPSTVECTPQLLRMPENSDTIDVKKLSSPVTEPKNSLSNTLCTQHYYPVLRHCSFFSFSHLRPFGIDDIETCALPGKWYLLAHPDVIIEVTGAADSSLSPFTKLEKVNITMHSFKCTADATINYVASLSDPDLPSTFTSDEYLKVKFLDPLDFNINKDRSIVSIVAPWLNLTIVITKHKEYLGVVLRMPIDLAKNSEGLCSNKCPSHSVLSTSFDNETCYHDTNSALFSCSENAGLRESRAPSFFVDICQFDVVYSLSYNNILSFLKSIALQFSLLGNYARDIIPEPGSPGAIVPSFPGAEFAPATSTKSQFSSLLPPHQLTSVQPSSVVTSTTNHVTHAPHTTLATQSTSSTQPQSTNSANSLVSLEIPSSSGTVHIIRFPLLVLAVLLPLFLLYRFQILF